MSHPEADPAIGDAPIDAAAPAGQGHSSAIARISPHLAPMLLVVLASAHGLAIWSGLGGYAGLSNGWPLWRDDHPLYFHSALVTRAFLKDSLATAGYDPSFMAGYAKSVIFPASSTLPELVVAAFGGSHPEFAYKIYVLLSAAAYPWLIALACLLLSIRGWPATIAVLLSLLYVWTDWPINYVTFGMLPYFLGVPVSLVATSAFARFLERRSVAAWGVATALLSFAVLVHLTTAMVAAPAALIGYVAASRRREAATALTWRTHAAVWLMPVVVLAVNAFWWLPGVFLVSTKGDSSFAFSHSGENVLERLTHILWTEAPIETILLAAGLPGLWLLARRFAVSGLALSGFCGAGLAWGYLAGAVGSLDFLQPGRHTFALYSGLSIAGAVALDEALRRLRPSPSVGLAGWAIVGLFLLGIRILGPSLWDSVRIHLRAGEPFLSSRPSARLLWVVERVRRLVKPRERLLYEESGKDLPGIPDPYRHGRFSGLLPGRIGVELIGGPYLHAALTTNFTQFGEGKLFGRANWDRDFFVRYARLYRPAAILCWSPHARAFCRSNPDLIRILEDDGTLLIGRVEGFGGDTIRGRARVEASPGRLRVTDIAPDLDGSVVLRYHFVPCLMTRPSVACEPEFLEEDPVPFIRLRPSPGIRDVELKMAFPPRP
jgi:hypothetical protein